MATAGAHYQNLLARHYTWMLGGDLEAAAARERQVLEDLGVRTGTVAVDLGCGPGPQTPARPYRDLTQPLQGLERFIPVRSDAERVMLCALDYQEPDTVTVNDLVYTHGPEGWELHKSSYPKLRLSPDWLRDQLGAAGLAIVHRDPGAGGMWSTVACLPT